MDKWTRTEWTDGRLKETGRETEKDWGWGDEEKDWGKNDGWNGKNGTAERGRRVKIFGWKS